MRVSDFHFDLPEELIAQHPPAVRGASRMLVVQRRAAGEPPALADARFDELPEFLRAGDLLVLNDSRVLPSRLYARRTGTTTQPSSPAPLGSVEVLLTEQLQDDGTEGTAAAERDGSAAAAPSGNRGLLWRALCRPAKKVHPGERLLFHDPAAPEGSAPVLTAEVVGLGCFGERTLRFAPTDDFYGIVSRIGHMPLPPYIHRDQAHTADTAEDRERYQTVYARDPRIAPPGSAAAPTAGLHFTPEMLDRLRARGVEIAYLTLHVGLGTFQPVRVEEVAEIRLHAERYTLPPETAEALNRALREGRRIVAVGTTTTRTLEHIASEAAAKQQGREGQAELGQQGQAESAQALQLRPHSGSTSIFLSPGHRFRVVSGLLTNFHLPESTLIMLVAAFAGNKPDGQGGVAVAADEGRREILAAYRHAVGERYRFFSYGDCMLLL